MSDDQKKKGKPTMCPICGRKLLDDERYCYFCELDVINQKAV